MIVLWSSHSCIDSMESVPFVFYFKIFKFQFYYLLTSVIDLICASLQTNKFNYLFYAWFCLGGNLEK